MSTKRVAIIIDDDNMSMIDYITQLQAVDFEVKQFFNPDDALNYVKQFYFCISVVVLDIMLPAGKRFMNHDTMSGLTTGLHLFRDIRARCPRAQVIFFTNVSDDTLYSVLRSFPDISRDRILKKMECDPMLFVKFVESLIKP